MKFINRSIVPQVLFVFITVLFINTSFAYSSASVSLAWDANDPAPEGYRVFAREAGGQYDYAHPIWENSLTTCTLTGLTEGVTYYFVVRAFDGSLESVDSEEVSYTPPLYSTESNTDSSTDTNTGAEADTNTETDSDGDNVLDAQDLFPNDPDEWADNDNDGIGNNLDTDDDNDGMTDEWEIAYGLDPLSDDADLDADGDGVSNLDEFLASSETITSTNAPEAPVLDSATETDRVSLTPVLLCGGYFDSDTDGHYQTRWQISTEADFSTLILDATSTTQLYTYAVGEMVLDVDTDYFWRAQFIDDNNGVSDWSDTATFTTVTAESMGDTDFDGLLDTQEADETADVNENGIADVLESNIMTINTIEGQTTVGVETLSEAVTLVSIKSLSAETVADRSVNLGFGLVGFKLYLQEGVKTASVKIHFSKKVPSTAKLYKYTIENGWNVYENAAFAANRKSVTLVLEDGGVGDEDGVENGVIVDPSGIAYQEEETETLSDSASVSTDDTTNGDSGSGGCFISAGSTGFGNMNTGSTTVATILTIALATLGVVSAKAVRVKK
ncbi:fibronectin type III domain protein [Desulfosarcina variabilis str. Montpellier]|uniref:choice-of-anchor U domain-containing protein n=1 Tax=Desulfosarcina variabilis TaxID=2300 RepID=UPI003AFA88E1